MRTNWVREKLPRGEATGAAFVLWLAWQIATAGRPGAAADGRPIGFVGAAAFHR